MPLAVAVPLGVAALGAASKYGAATSGSKAAREAAAAQERSTSAALEYQKGRDILGDKQKAEVWADYQRRHDAWEQRNFGSRNGGGSSGGIQQNYSGAPPAGQTGGGWTGPATLQGLAGAGAMAPVAGANGIQSQSDVSGGQGGTLQDLARWNDWGPYLQPRA